jgi:hypothetical protein
VDDQLRGPSLVSDHVRYRLPVAPLSAPAHPLIRRQLYRIFSYRQERVRELTSQTAE